MSHSDKGYQAPEKLPMGGTLYFYPGGRVFRAESKERGAWSKGEKKKRYWFKPATCIRQPVFLYGPCEPCERKLFLSVCFFFSRILIRVH